MSFPSRALSDLHQLATSKSFQDLVILAKSLKPAYGHTQSEEIQHITLSKSRVDKIAESLLPPHYLQENAKPILTKADGNCLFNAASIALCGSDKLSTNLRVRTTIELATQSSFYLYHPNIVNSGLKRKNGEPWDVQAIYYATIFGNPAAEMYSTRGFEAAFQHEIISTAGYGTFCGLLQIMGLASAIGREVHLIYPDTKHTMLYLLNGVYPPRQFKDETRQSIVIMWSNLSGWSDRTKLFKVNHFVPIMPIQTSSGNGDDRDSVQQWNVVKIKRKATPPTTHSSAKLIDLSQLTCETGSYSRSEDKQNDCTMPKKRRKNYVNRQIKTGEYDAVKEWHLSMPLLGECWFGERDKMVHTFLQDLQSETVTRLSQPDEDEIEVREKEELLTMPRLQEAFYALSGEVQSLSKNYQMPESKRNESNDITIPKKKIKYDVHGQFNINENGNSVSEWQLSMPLLQELWFEERNEKVEHTVITHLQADTLSTLTEQHEDKIEDSEAFYAISGDVECPADNDYTLNESRDFCKDEAPSMQLHEIRLQLLSQNWYNRRGRLASKNNSRSIQTQVTERIATNKDTIGIRKNGNDDAIEENVKVLNEKVEKETNLKKCAELYAVAEVGKFVMKCGPLVTTQEAGDVYKNAKKSFLGETTTKKTKNRPSSSYLFGRFSPHLNIQQIYVHGKAYIVEGRNRSVEQLVKRLNSIIPKDKIVNDRLENNLSEIFKDSLRFMDTKRDRDVLKGVFAKATSAKFTAKLQGVKNRTAIANCRDELEGKLDKFSNLERTSLIVSNAMTNEQQRLFTKRLIHKRKNKEFKLKLDSRGRMLKCEQWPDLAQTLEYIFHLQDLTERAGGGLEAHPRLKEDILYRSKDNNTFMRQAHAIINTMSPPSFNISLSSCFNYTMTYKKNAAAAIRHHHGMNVNANISLHRPPHTKVDRLVVNLHYSSANVNYICDDANRHKDNILIDSKDAKKIVCADIAPTQKSSKVWTSIEYPDHDWDQSRTNAVTPMTHLFLRTDIAYRETSIMVNPAVDEVDILSPISSTVLHITRTGKAVSLLNPSLLEPETTFRLFHETLLLLSKPSLDKYFRNPEAGSLKEEFVFIVDNGPAEDPSSPLVQMLLVRLLRLLNLDKVTQASFAEYHSKRNFVERIHATEDKLLARHGPFTSHGIHNNTNILPGSKEHVENMEKMCELVENCLRQGKFDGNPLEVFRGVKKNSFLFDDEEELKLFLSLSEERKNTCDWTYKINKSSSLFDNLVAVWNINSAFQGSYLEDYQILNNCLPTVEVRTAWRDKYTTVVYRVDGDWKGRSLSRKEYQPVPDYLRWIQTKGELHYLPLEHLDLVSGTWNETPGLFRPERLLDLLFKLNSHPLDDMYKYFAILVWLPERSVADYFQEKQNNLSNDLQHDLLREKWRKHTLYNKKVDDLRALCKKNGLPHLGQKHELVQQLVEKETDPSVPEDYTPDYDGDLTTVGKTASEIRKYPVARIRFILNYHGLPTSGTKEELILRLLLVCHRRYYLCFKQEEEEILKTISLAEDIILEEKRQFIVNSEYTYRKRTHSTTKCNSHLKMPDDTHFNNLQDIFKPLKEYISILNKLRRQKDTELSRTEKLSGNTDLTKTNDYGEYDEFFVIGRKLKVKWTKEEIGDSGWRAGWYSAQVQESQIEEDNISVMYFTEPNCVYTICVSGYLADGKLKLA